jgi:uroporphyrinogen decarboxylase
MKPRERFIAALERRPIAGRVPHFELVFFLTMEAFGKVHPSHRRYDQWFQMTETERKLHRQDMADIFIATARRYEHSAIFIHNPVGGVEEYQRLIDKIRAKTGDTYFLMMHGDATYGLPSGETMMEWVSRMYDRPQELEDEAQRNVDRALARAEKLRGKGLDGFALTPAPFCVRSSLPAL